MGFNGREALEALGAGIDITAVERVAALCGRKSRAMARLFTPVEIDDAGSGRHQFPRLASRFAAKEALIKAAGGLHGSTYRDIEIRRRPGEAPVVRVSGPLRSWLDKAGLAITLSLSHERDFAVAMVFLVPREGGQSHVRGSVDT